MNRYTMMFVVGALAAALVLITVWTGVALAADGVAVCGASSCTNQLDIGTVTPKKVGFAAKRFSLVITNWEPSTGNSVFCGPSATIAATNGARVAPGAARNWGSIFSNLPSASDDQWCIATGGTVHIDYTEGTRP